MRFASFLCICVFALAIPATAIAQPVNDECSNALPLLVGETTFSTIAATTDGSDLSGFCELGPFGDDNLQNDIWYTFTAHNTGNVELSVCSTANFDSRLAVYESETVPRRTGDSGRLQRRCEWLRSPHQQTYVPSNCGNEVPHSPRRISRIPARLRNTLFDRSCLQ